MEDNAPEGLVISTQILLVVSLSLSTISSFKSASSSRGILSLFNSFQMLILLPMIPDYFPPTIVQFILGMDFTMASFDFIPAVKIPLVDEIAKLIKLPQKDGYLNEIGLNSSS